LLGLDRVLGDLLLARLLESRQRAVREPLGDILLARLLLHAPVKPDSSSVPVRGSPPKEAAHRALDRLVGVAGTWSMSSSGSIGSPKDWSHPVSAAADSSLAAADESQRLRRYPLVPSIPRASTEAAPAPFGASFSYS
jgi:hypothetical protein